MPPYARNEVWSVVMVNCWNTNIFDSPDGANIMHCSVLCIAVCDRCWQITGLPPPPPILVMDKRTVIRMLQQGQQLNTCLADAVGQTNGIMDPPALHVTMQLIV